MIRLMYGVTARPSVAAGRITTLRCCHAWSPGGIRETAGKTWNTEVANRSTRMIPIKNSGSAASASDTVDPT